jgi:diguanylate cyclase (GGDEF)-like protein
MIAQEGPFAVVVSDMRMPGMNGLELLSRLKASQPDTIRIMLTGNADQKTAVDAVNQGEVFRFLTKPCHSRGLASTLDEGLALYHRIAGERAAREQNSHEVQLLTERLSYQSQHDLLTGLANRQAFEIGLRHALDSARSEGRCHALCNIDLDNFLVVNDTCGHVAGDECLRQIANLISSQQRHDDLVSRLAGNQFGILLKDRRLDEASDFVKRLHGLIRSYSFHWEEDVIDINASIGLIPITRESSSLANLLSEVETACNVAKDRGRNSVHIGKPDDLELTRRLNRSQWIHKINQALRQDRFQLFYQRIEPLSPAVETGDHFEVLVRMLDSQGQTVMPAEFLPVAEQANLATLIDGWVIQHVVDWFENNPDDLDRTSVCAINLSGHSIGNRELLTSICNRFERSKIPPQKICFEVTETAAITHLNQAVQFIKTLKQMGFKFSLDDFGSGFSSFAYLRNLPVDYLKIDGQFIKNIHGDPVDRAMVKSIVEIAKLMNKSTIAEYVENERILDILRTLGIDYAQGYYFSVPRPLAARDRPRRG